MNPYSFRRLTLPQAPIYRHRRCILPNTRGVALDALTVSFVKRELRNSERKFAFIEKPGLLQIECLPGGELFVLVWDSGRGGGLRLLPEQHSEVYDFVNARVQKAIRQKMARDRILARKSQSAIAQVQPTGKL